MVPLTSAHAQVGALLTIVREEFTLALASPSEGSNSANGRATGAVKGGVYQAAHALQLAFELLQFGSINCSTTGLEVVGPDSDAEAAHAQGRGKRGGHALFSGVSRGGVDDDEKIKERRRTAFLQSSFLPFASFLLREVGPIWLPIWDRTAATAPADASIFRSNGSLPVSQMNAHVEEKPRGNEAVASISAGYAAEANGAFHAREHVLLNAGDMFRAFFRPPLVPASLAILALSEALGSRPSSKAHYFSGEAAAATVAGLGEENARKHDARTVQLACRLLEPYLDPLLQQSNDVLLLQLPHDDSPGASSDKNTGNSIGGDGNNDTTILFAGNTSNGDGFHFAANTKDGLSSSRKLEDEEEELRDGDRKNGSAIDFLCRSRHPLFIEALMELALSKSIREPASQLDTLKLRPVERGTSRNEGGRGGRGGSIGEAVAAGDAVERLISALCLAPQRVANALGPLAPPTFSPGILFPAMCRAVVRSILVSFSLRLAGEGSLTRWEGEAGACKDGEGTAAVAPGEKTKGAAAAAEEDPSSTGILADVRYESAAEAGIDGDEVRQRWHARAQANAATREVWRACSGRLLMAGRSSDLADAWLRAIVLIGAKGPKEPQVTQTISLGVPKVAAAAATGAEATGASGGDASSSSSDIAGAPLPGLEAATVTSTLTAIAAWEAWAEGPKPDVHARMMRSIPPSSRKSFTEALLRALWPPPPSRSSSGRVGPSTQRRGPNLAKQQHQLWPPGFPSAVCRALIGRNLVARRSVPLGDEGWAEGGGTGEDAELWVSLLEDLLLRQPLPPPAAEAIADILAWCDRRAEMEEKEMAERGGVVGRGGEGGRWRGRFAFAAAGRRKRRRPLLIGTLKRVVAVWAEPSFVNSSPPRQQEFYSRFLVAALHRYVRVFLFLFFFPSFCMFMCVILRMRFRFDLFVESRL